MPRHGNGTSRTSHSRRAPNKPNQLTDEELLHAIARRGQTERETSPAILLASIPLGIADPPAALRRISNGVLSGGLYRGPRTLRNKAVCKDAVCSLV